jgi:hypothetical protein
MRFLLLSIAGLISAFTIGQPDVVVYGAVKDIRTGERLTGITVEAIDLKWGRWELAATNDSSKYELDLGRNGEWLLTYSASGYVSKRIKLILFGPTPEEWIGGFGMNVDMTMIQPQEGVDYSILDEPFGICRYNRETGNFEWDLPYTEKMREQQAALLKAQ